MEAKRKGCQVICLPEAFDFLGVPGSGDGYRLSSLLTEELMKNYCDIAKREKVWLSLGGFHERLGEEEKKTQTMKETEGREEREQPRIANAHLMINSEGQIVAKYRKIHMFDTDYDGGYRESKATKRGTELVCVDTPVGRIGLTVCYDVRFPAIFSRLAKEGKCDLILVPSAFMPTTGKAHWHTLLKARAIENQCYIAAPAQVGKHNEKRSSYGHSLIVDPWGTVVCDLENKEKGVGVAEIDRALLQSVRKKMPMFNQPDINCFPLTIITADTK